MTKEVKDLAVERVHEVLNVNTCKEGKEAAEKWLAALDTDEEADATAAMIAEFEEDVAPIDEVIAMSGSEQARKILGEEKANAMHAHAVEVKNAGGTHCDCPACTAVSKVLELKDQMLA